jgi:hypothetical protein
LEEVAEGRMPSSFKGLRVRAETRDFVQSPTRFLAAVEADDALEAMGFFPLPMVVGRIFAGARESDGNGERGEEWCEENEVVYGKGEKFLGTGGPCIYALDAVFLTA